MFSKKSSEKDVLCVVTDADGRCHTFKKLPTCGTDQLCYHCNWCYHFISEGENIKTAYYCEECRYGFLYIPTGVSKIAGTSIVNIITRLPKLTQHLA